VAAIAQDVGVGDRHAASTTPDGHSGAGLRGA
jgi:hypothetical protein